MRGNRPAIAPAAVLAGGLSVVPVVPVVADVAEDVYKTTKLWREAAERHGRRWARARKRRLTEYALRQLDGRALRDIGLTAGEIGADVVSRALQLLSAVWARDGGSSHAPARGRRDDAPVGDAFRRGRHALPGGVQSRADADRRGSGRDREVGGRDVRDECSEGCVACRPSSHLATPRRSTPEQRFLREASSEKPRPLSAARPLHCPLPQALVPGSEP
jgi:uncharacterized protein YjiS (DUF1127 family)